MAAAEQRKLLEQLMGADALGGANANVTFEDPSVCKNYLCGECPHTLFTNTKMDLGPCAKRHSDKLRDDYQAALKAGKEYPVIEAEYERNLTDFVAECDRKIRAQMKRLEKTPEESSATARLIKEIQDLDEKIEEILEEVEVHGEKGLVDEALKKLTEAENIRQVRWAKEGEVQNISETSGGSGHQKLRVCETCSAFLSVLDNDSRLKDHFGGKLHLGYKRLREILQQLSAKRRKIAVENGGKNGVELPLTPSAMRNPPSTSNNPEKVPDQPTNGHSHRRERERDDDHYRRGSSFRGGNRGGRYNDRRHDDRYDRRRSRSPPYRR